MKHIKYIVIKIIFICASILFIPSLCFSANLQDDVDPKIQQMIITYFENNPNLRPEENAFVYCDFLGMSTKGDKIEVYAWCVPWTFELKDNQVLEGGGSSVATVIYLEKSKNGLKVKNYEEPDDGSGYDPSISRMFPEQYQKHLYRPDKLAIEAKKVESRIVNYYSAMLNKDRFIDKTKPTILKDSHNHREPIYSYLNLKDSYRQVSFVLQKNMAKVVTTGGGDPILSPDGRFKAWIGVDQKTHLYFEDRTVRRRFYETITEYISCKFIDYLFEGKTERRIYEVVNRTKNWMTHIAWKGDHILVFDQNNGVNRFNPHPDWKSADSIHGVHFEIDPDKREILWAVPFGELSFPMKK